MTAATRSVLVIDVGTSSVRAAIVHDDATVAHVHQVPCPPIVPFPGLAEIDGHALAAAVMTVAHAALAAFGAPVAAVGVATQRTSTLAWSPDPSAPHGVRMLGNGLGWQDLRTVGTCLELKAEDIHLAPNQTATKAQALLVQAAMLGTPVPDDLRIGTVDAFVANLLTGGAAHVSDATNAALTGLVLPATIHTEDPWDRALCARLGVPVAALPRVVDTAGAVAECRALPGAPPLAALAGDQQASLVGQRCTVPGLAKLTLGTGGFCDAIRHGGADGTALHAAPATTRRGERGTFPIVAWRHAGVATWGHEGVMLSAGSCVDWLVEDLGLVDDAAATDALAASVPDTGGVVFVPALLGLGTPDWDYGARGTLVGLTRGSTAAHVVRAVLEGIAHRGADLVEAVEAETGVTVTGLRVDGGMSVNATFVQALADATGRPVEVSPEREATTVGAGLLAGWGVGVWADLADVAATWRPAGTVSPAPGSDRDATRQRWRDAIGRSRGWEPALSALDF